MDDKQITVTSPLLPNLDEFNEMLKEIWASKWITNNGQFHKQLEKALAEYLKVPYISLFTNGTLPLLTALQALRITGEVITTPYSFVATTHSIWWNGCKPVFVDIEEETCGIDPNKIEAAITPKTTAIMPVHCYGKPVKIKQIQEIADKYGLKVIYDAAHAFGEKFNGKSSAKYGDACMFSFHATKAFNSIEGGLSVVHDTATLTKVYQLHNFGIMDEEHVEFVGANAKMNEFQAAMGLCNLKHFEENRLKRKDLFTYYRQRLSDIKGIRFLDYDEVRNEFNYTYCPIFIDKETYGMDRNELFEILSYNHVHSRKYFYPIVNEFNCYKDAGFRGETPIAKKLSEEVLTLPLYTDLRLEQVKMICDIIEANAKTK